MSNFKIFTETTCDLPKSYYEEHDIATISLACIMDGEVYNKDNEITDEEFYKKLRGGSMPTTSQINPEQAKEAFLEILKDYNEILYIGFSAGLSGSCQSSIIAANEIMEENPEVKIHLVSSLCASMGQGLFLHKAVEMRDQGKSAGEIAQYLEEHKQNLIHLVAVDDLFHLYRGGRVSKSAAVVGSMIGIKPVIHVDSEGKLIVVDKVRGRKKSLLSLVDRMEKQIGSYREPDKDEYIFISHSDCREDAEFLAAEIKKRFGYDKFMINYIGPVIGSHTGPGTVALFFWGDVR